MPRTPKSFKRAIADAVSVFVGRERLQARWRRQRAAPCMVSASCAHIPDKPVAPSRFASCCGDTSCCEPDQLLKFVCKKFGRIG